jgi:hypothetical protein
MMPQLPTTARIELVGGPADGEVIVGDKHADIITVPELTCGGWRPVTYVRRPGTKFYDYSGEPR